MQPQAANQLQGIANVQLRCSARASQKLTTLGRGGAFIGGGGGGAGLRPNSTFLQQQTNAVSAAGRFNNSLSVD